MLSLLLQEHWKSLPLLRCVSVVNPSVIKSKEDMKSLQKCNWWQLGWWCGQSKKNILTVLCFWKGTWVLQILWWNKEIQCWKHTFVNRVCINWENGCGIYSNGICIRSKSSPKIGTCESFYKDGVLDTVCVLYCRNDNFLHFSYTVFSPRKGEITWLKRKRANWILIWELVSFSSINRVAMCSYCWWHAYSNVDDILLTLFYVTQKRAFN